jgi:hypothetical protein
MEEYWPPLATGDNGKAQIEANERRSRSMSADQRKWRKISVRQLTVITAKQRAVRQADAAVRLVLFVLYVSARV